MCDSPNLDCVQGVAGRPVHWHFAHDEHHDFSSLVVWQIPTEEAWRRRRGRQRWVRTQWMKKTFKVIFTNTCRHMFIKTNTLWSNRGARTDGLDDGVLDDPLLALFTADGRNAGGGVPPRAVAQLKVHAHPQVFEQSVEHLQHGGPCQWTSQETLAWHFRKQEESSFHLLFIGPFNYDFVGALHRKSHKKVKKEGIFNPKTGPVSLHLVWLKVLFWRPVADVVETSV